MTQLESSIEPPGRVPFSISLGWSPSSRARAAATSPAMPAPAMSTSAQGERRLVLDVLDANALRPAEEHRVGIGRVDDVVDLDAEVVRGRERLVGRVDEHGEMVQQGLLRHAGIS